MTRRKNVPAVQSFGPELLALLKQGAVSRQVVNLTLDEDGKARDAMKLRHRLHILRSAMRHHEHPDAELVEKAKVSIDANGNLIVQPQDSEFADAIKKAGAKTPELEVDPLANFEAEKKK